jgi:hypothetical protein
MSDPDYKQAVRKHIDRYEELNQQREKIEAEQEKLRFLIRATLNMLSDDDREGYEVLFEAMSGRRTVGLTEATTNVLKTGMDWMSPVAIRDQLVGSGFDFNAYTSNPLASIHTVLKRLPTEQVEKKAVGSTTYYRWKETKGLLNVPFGPGNIVSLQSLMASKKKGIEKK